LEVYLQLAQPRRSKNSGNKLISRVASGFDNRSVVAAIGDRAHLWRETRQGVGDDVVLASNVFDIIVKIVQQ
jgi:hypothetical protein